MRKTRLHAGRNAGTDVLWEESLLVLANEGCRDVCVEEFCVLRACAKKLDVGREARDLLCAHA